MENGTSRNIPSDSRISAVCTNSTGVEVHGSALRLSRHQIALEVYTPAVVLQLSEALPDFRIFIQDRLVYAGRAVVTKLIEAGLMVLAEASLGDHWMDIDWLEVNKADGEIQRSFHEFIQHSQHWGHLDQEFKTTVSDLEGFFGLT